MVAGGSFFGKWAKAFDNKRGEMFDNWAGIVGKWAEMFDKWAVMFGKWAENLSIDGRRRLKNGRRLFDQWAEICRSMGGEMFDKWADVLDKWAVIPSITGQRCSMKNRRFSINGQRCLINGRRILRYMGGAFDKWAENLSNNW